MAIRRSRLTSLRRAARSYLRQGWTVAPAAYPSGDRMVCADKGCWAQSPHLVRNTAMPVRTVQAAEEVWSTQPFSIAALTGPDVHVAQVTWWLGARTFGRLEGCRRGRPGPVARGPNGDWWFPMRPGEGHWSDWPESHVLLHGDDSWVPLPPSRDVAGEYRWMVPPRGELPRALPDADRILGAIARELRAAHHSERWSA